MKLLIVERPEGSIFNPKFYFEQKGYEVDLLDISFLEKSFFWRAAYYKFNTSQVKIFISKYIFNKILTFDFDKILFFNIDYISLRHLEELKLRMPKKEILCWHGDDIVNKRFGNNETLKIKFIDTHISGRNHRENYYRKEGADNFIKINWFSKTFAKTQVLNPKFNINFCGSYSKKRHNILSDLSPDNSILAGYGWKNKGINFKYMKNHLSLEDLNEVFQNSKISLNILTDENNDKTNFRNFEIPSQYSLQICERTLELEEIFEENKSIVFFDNTSDLNEKIKYYLKNDSSRNSIIGASNDLVRSPIFSVDYQFDLILQHFKNG